MNTRIVTITRRFHEIHMNGHAHTACTLLSLVSLAQPNILRFTHFVVYTVVCPLFLLSSIPYNINIPQFVYPFFLLINSRVVHT